MERNEISCMAEFNLANVCGGYNSSSIKKLNHLKTGDSHGKSSHKR